MANSINYRISLEGADQVNKELLSIEQAVKQLQRAAKDSGGTANFASTTAAISKLGKTSEEAFAGAGAAAQKFGASIGQLKAVDQVIAELRLKSRESGVAFATLAQNYDIARASAARAGSGFAQVGKGAESATGHVANLRQELHTLTKVASVAGIGAFGELGSALGGAATHFGAAAAAIAAFVITAGSLTKFALDAAKVAEGLTTLSEVSGVSFKDVSELQGAFQLAGVGAEQFSQQFTNLAANVEKSSEELARANLAVKDSHLALAQAQQQGMQITQQFADLQLQAAQRVQQARQLDLQAKQIQLQEASLRLQLAFLPQINALESKRAELTLKGAEGQLRMLNLEDQFRAGNISEAEFEERRQQLARQDREQQKEALRLQVEEAKLREEMQAEEQQQREAQLKMQLKQLQMQKDALKLQQQVLTNQNNNAALQEKALVLQQKANELAIQKAELDTKAAEKAQRLAELQDKVAQAVLRGKQGMAEIAELFKGLTAAKALELGKKLGLDQKTIDLLRQGPQAIAANEKAVQSLGIALNEVDQKNLKEFADRWERATGLAGQAMQKLGAQFARAVNDMFTLPISELAYRAFIGFVGVLKEVFVDSWIAIGRDLGTAFMTYVYNPLTAWVATPIANAWQWIVDTFWAAVSWVQSLIDTVKGWISKWVTTPIANAWQWILDTFWNTIGVFQTYMDTVTGWITKFVTTPIANAWQWIKDTFWAVVKSLGIGGAGGSGGGNTGENAGGNASLNPVDSIQGVVRDIQTREQKRDDIMREIIRGIEDSQRHALGGLLGGRGTGTSDSNLAWVSRGEHIMPAAAVRQPGVLAFLEALRRSGGNLSRVLDGLGRFAMGGLVSMPAFAAGGGVGGMSHVTIAFPGLAPISGLRASSAVVEELQRAAATAQVRSGGRKPSRYT